VSLIENPDFDFKITWGKQDTELKLFPAMKVRVLLARCHMQRINARRRGPERCVADCCQPMHALSNSCLPSSIMILTMIPTQSWP